MNIKTVTTVDGINTVDFGNTPDRYYWCKNVGDTCLYVSTNPSCTADADGVAKLAAGDVTMLENYGDQIYVFGAGKVEIHEQETPDCPFKSAPINNGGVSGGYNPNLLINPDFGINQYGFSVKPIGTSQIYFIDRWYGSRCTVAKNSNGGIDLSWNGIDGSDGWIQQKIENTKYLFGKDVIISADVDGIRKSAHIVVPTTTNASAYYALSDNIKVAISNYAGNYISVVIYNNSVATSNINNIKLEVGASATPFIPYNPAAELIKCQRYYQIRSTNNIAAADLRPNMREGITPTIMALSGGNYSYSAEL